MPRGYVPNRGDLVWLEFSPQSGHEQAGRRPALVLSSKQFNAKIGLALVCPITSRAKGYPFEVRLPSTCKTAGVVLVDQVKTLDWKSRRAMRIESAPAEVVDGTIELVEAILTN